MGRTVVPCAYVAVDIQSRDCQPVVLAEMFEAGSEQVCSAPFGAVAAGGIVFVVGWPLD